MIIAHTCISANYYMPDTALRTLQKVSWVSILQAEYLFSGGYCVIFFNLFKKGDVLQASSNFTLHFVAVLAELGLHCHKRTFSVSCGDWTLLASCGRMDSSPRWFLLLQRMGSRRAGLLCTVALLHAESS